MAGRIPRRHMVGVRAAGGGDPGRPGVGGPADPGRRPGGSPRRARAPHPRGAGSRRPRPTCPAPAGPAPARRQRDRLAPRPGERVTLGSMAKPAVRLRVVEVAVFLGLLLLLGRAGQVQLLQGRRWAEEARARRTERIGLPARRGALLDRHGAPLALTQETYHVGIAPNELRDPEQDGELIAHRLGLSGRAWQQALRQRYAYFGGPYRALAAGPLRS